LPNGSVGSAACIPTVSSSDSFLTPTPSIDRRRYARMRRILGSTCYLSPRADGGAPTTGLLRIWAMKGTCHRFYRLHCQFNPAAAMGKEIATGFLIRAWEAVTTAALDDAWALYEGRYE
jgi:hypothetical protein